ncbi:hypothetical protein QT970_04575 [Microcoleus sp. herbarium8]|uniref:hypothetical protein n=1 Tax=Microcoleus sp. herbarium8 TaxID=3055436 RepID=UPI002FD380E8
MPALLVVISHQSLVISQQLTVNSSQLTVNSSQSTVISHQSSVLSPLSFPYNVIRKMEDAIDHMGFIPKNILTYLYI